MARRCLVFRHVAFEDLGIFQPELARAGYDVQYREMGVDAADTADALAAGLLVVLGGPIGVYESDAYPFLATELVAIRARIEAGLPTLGICLGHQLIAVATGAFVGPGLVREIGWAPVRLTDEGRKSPLAPLDGRQVLHWHGDIATLPEGAQRLAETEPCRNQAFMLGANVLALQFHVEADPGRIEQWLIGHAVELAKAGIDPAAIRDDTRRFGAATASAGASVLRSWLAGLANPAAAESARA
jgi:GMP synthase (glutamine-hydrolysing)